MGCSFCLVRKQGTMYEREIHQKILTHLQKLDQKLTASCAPNRWPAATAFVCYQFSIVFYRDFFTSTEAMFTPYPLIIKNVEVFFLKRDRLLRVVHSHRQSSAARLSSSRDCGENTDNRARSVRMCVSVGNADAGR